MYIYIHIYIFIYIYVYICIYIYILYIYFIAYTYIYLEPTLIFYVNAFKILHKKERTIQESNTVPGQIF